MNKICSGLNSIVHPRWKETTSWADVRDLCCISVPSERTGSTAKAQVTVPADWRTQVTVKERSALCQKMEGKQSGRKIGSAQGWEGFYRGCNTWVRPGKIKIHCQATHHFAPWALEKCLIRSDRARWLRESGPELSAACPTAHGRRPLRERGKWPGHLWPQVSWKGCVFISLKGDSRSLPSYLRL